MQTYDLAVLGGGAGGLAAARAGVRGGKRTALIQDGRLGGDCTFTGCVPSKSLIESAERGLSFSGAVARLHAVVEQIADTESAEVLTREGVTVINGRARFEGPRTLSVGTATVRARRVVIATGSSPAVPPVRGLSEVGYLTNETVFDLAELPRSLAVLGGGAIGCELAQAFRRYGAEVHIIEAADRLLPSEEPAASKVIEEVFRAEAIGLHLEARLVQVGSSPEELSGVRLELADGSQIAAERLLVAVGRRPITDGLDLDRAGVEVDEHGCIKTDRYLRTSEAGTYAVGDVAGKMLFTHVADEMGRLATRNALHRVGRKAFASSAIPWVTFTDPEVGSVGITESEAASRGARVAQLPMTESDRAIIAGRTEGFVKLIAGPRRLLRTVGGGELLGATIVAPRAGEMIHEVALAMRTGMFTGRLAQTVHAYPTWSVAIRQAAAQFFER